MGLSQIEDVERLKRINDALVNRVERAMDQQRNAFSLFQTAISLEGQVRRRTDELTATLRSLERTNTELARQKEISERANQSKTRFLAAASHDVLQPLHAAQLTMSTLYDLQDSNRGRAMVRQVERSLDTMDELLRTLLDISRLDAGVTTPSHESVAIEPVVQSLLSDLRPIAEAKGLKLRTALSGAWVWSDRVMLRRALQNLISNAIRYTDKGGILIGTRPRGDFVSIEVVDTGCGIPEDQHDQIFEEFHRGTSSKSASEGDCALGLGLAIVKRLVTTLHHDLTVASRPGSGSSFRILARRAKPAPDLVTLPKAQVRFGPEGTLAGRSILLVENDPAVIDAMTQLLDSWGSTYKVARSQGEAVSVLGVSEWQPDLVIADQHLDQGTLGTNTIAAIRTLFGDAVPCILATADTSERVMAEADRLGAEHLPKPVKPAQLRALMSHLIGLKSGCG